MAEIKSGDKVKLNRKLSYKKIVMKNGEVENESVVSWDEGTEHTVTAVVGDLFVVLEGISTMVPISYVEKVEEFYTGKVVCVSCPDKSTLFTVGKVYEIKNGYISCNDMTKLGKIKNLDELNRHPYIVFAEIKNPDALKKDKYYNGKVICISNHGCDEGYWTCGKIYKFKDGITHCDNGETSPLSGDKIKSYDELQKSYPSMFLEIKE